MSRKFVLFSVAVFLLFGSISTSLAETVNLAKDLSKAAQDSNKTQQVSNKVQQASVMSNTGTTAAAKALTLEEAFKLSLENNIDLKKARLDYDSAIIDSEQARYNADKTDEDEVNTLQSAQTKYLSPKQKALAESIAKQTYDIAIEQNKILVEQNYYSTLMAENVVKVREASVKRAQEQLSLVEKKFKAGTAVKSDVNKAEISLANTKADLTNAQRDYKNAQITLNKILGLDVNTNIKPAVVLKYEKVTLPKPEDLTKQALDKRIDIQRARNTQAITQETYNLVVSYQASNTFDARKKKIELEKTKLDVLQQEQNVKAEVISTLFQVEKSDEVVGISAKSLQQAKDNYDLVKRRYEIGVGTVGDVLSAAVDLADADAKYVQAVYNYTTTKNQLKTVVLVSK